MEIRTRTRNIINVGYNNTIYGKYIKRCFDFLAALLALVILSPLLLIISLIVKIKLGSPVIFKQKRVGYSEKIFTLYKFRTMTDKKDEKGNLLPDNFRTPNIGIMLRKTSLDELPELFNILKGDMSFVGPRPLIVDYLPYYTEEERLRHTIRPGLTGLAQINGRSFLTWEKRFELDNEYVNNCSLWQDLKIIYKTFWQVLRKKNVANTQEIKVDEKGTYLYVEGQVFRRLDVERRGMNAQGNRE